MQIVHRHFYCDRGDHVSYRNASHYADNPDSALTRLDNEIEFDHQLSDAEIAQHFSETYAKQLAAREQG
jgi:hypothetical protein